MRPVALLSDFGSGDHYAGMMHAVLVRRAPAAPRFDLTHAVPRGDLWTACYLLWAAWSHLPADTVVLAVVDPGVGTARRAVAAGYDGRWVVAPDNGLVTAVGSPDVCVELEAGRLGVAVPSATFHGRDLFAPAAGRLAGGETIDALGPRCDPASLAPSPLPTARRGRGGVEGAVWHVDHFGNVVTNVPAAWAPAAARVRVGPHVVASRVRTYGEAPGREPVVLEGSAGLLEISVKGGSAAAALGVARGDDVTVELD